LPQGGKKVIVNEAGKDASAKFKLYVWHRRAKPGSC
jgi:cytochrome b involved in lipid metabolism